MPSIIDTVTEVGMNPTETEHMLQAVAAFKARRTYRPKKTGWVCEEYRPDCFIIRWRNPKKLSETVMSVVGYFSDCNRMKQLDFSTHRCARLHFNAVAQAMEIPIRIIRYGHKAWMLISPWGRMRLKSEAWLFAADFLRPPTKYFPFYECDTHDSQ